jgi:hypothetical protein
MIEYKNEKERQLLLFYAENFHHTEAEAILKRGFVNDAEDVRLLASLYWKMVDEAEGENMDYWLNRIYTTLYIHVGNSGFGDEWDRLIPE